MTNPPFKLLLSLSGQLLDSFYPFSPHSLKSSISNLPSFIAGFEPMLFSCYSIEINLCTLSSFVCTLFYCDNSLTSPSESDISKFVCYCCWGKMSSQRGNGTIFSILSQFFVLLHGTSTSLQVRGYQWSHLEFCGQGCTITYSESFSLPVISQTAGVLPHTHIDHHLTCTSIYTTSLVVHLWRGTLTKIIVQAMVISCNFRVVYNNVWGHFHKSHLRARITPVQCSPTSYY